MKCNMYSWYILIGLLSSLKLGTGLTCHRCLAKGDVDSCGKGSSSLPKMTCSAVENRCATTQYDVVKNGLVVSSLYRRGCVIENNFCEGAAAAVGPAFKQRTFNLEGEMIQSKCELCDTDLCNAGGGGDENVQELSKKSPRRSCYTCFGDVHDESCEVGDFSLSTVECASIENICFMVAYDVVKDGMVTGVIYKRGCAVGGNFCESASNIIGLTYRSMNITDETIVQKRCEVCEENLCNGGAALAKKRQERLRKRFPQSSGNTITYSLLNIIFVMLILVNILN